MNQYDDRSGQATTPSGGTKAAPINGIRLEPGEYDVEVLTLRRKDDKLTLSLDCPAGQHFQDLDWPAHRPVPFSARSQLRAVIDIGLTGYHAVHDRGKYQAVKPDGTREPLSDWFDNPLVLFETMRRQGLLPDAPIIKALYDTHGSKIYSVEETEPTTKPSVGN